MAEIEAVFHYTAKSNRECRSHQKIKILTFAQENFAKKKGHYNGL
jgi:hypothetical protein